MSAEIRYILCLLVEVKTALLDIMGAFPRTVYSESDMGTMTWLAKELGVSEIPSLKQVKYCRNGIQEEFGFAPSLKESGLGNMYAEIDLERVLADVR